jgi:hypothetical protein
MAQVAQNCYHPVSKTPGRGCGANNLREADVIVMSSGITKLFKFILYDLLIKTSFCSICLTEQCSRVQVSIKKSGFYHLLQYKLNLAATAEKQDATQC